MLIPTVLQLVFHAFTKNISQNFLKDYKFACFNLLESAEIFCENAW